MAQTYFATIVPGLEAALLEEVRELGGRKAKEVKGGVEFQGTNKVFYKMLLGLRTANGLMLRLDEFRARDTPELYNKSRRFDWERLLKPEHKVFVRSAAHRSRLIHTDVISRTVGFGVREHFIEELKQAGPEVLEEREGADQIVFARLDDDRCELSLDAAGELLHRRGWRTRIGPAPIRETTAAALLRVARWETGMPIVDPMCGSGTFVIEAAQRAAGLSAGVHRSFAAEKWANFDAALWQELVNELAQGGSSPEPLFYGFDLDPKVIDGAKANVRAAQVGKLCRFEARDVAKLVPPISQPGLVICNPPYGERIDAKKSVATLLERFSREFKGWRLAILLPWEQVPSRKGLEFVEAARFENGGIPVRLWLAEG